MNSKKIMPFEPFSKSKQVKFTSRKKEEASDGRTRFGFKITLLLIVLLLASPLVFNINTPNQESRSQLEKIRQSGELTVAVLGAPPVDKDTDSQPENLDFELAQRLADRLGVKLRYVQANSRRELIGLITHHEADFIATALPVTEERKHTLRFSTPFRRLTEKVVYRTNPKQDSPTPTVFRDIPSSQDGASDSASYDLKDRLRMVNDGLLDYTVVPSDQIVRMQRNYPNIGVAFELGEPQMLAWAFAKSDDASLYDEVFAFFEEITRDNTLTRLTKQYEAAWITTDTLEDTALKSRVRQRLPHFQALFQKAGQKFDIDWRLLAAIAYQESQWDAHAVSAEGVRGMMMLTGDTARELNVTDRFDVNQSIRGGAEYLHEILEGLPGPIQGQDRVWLALAAYNIGYNHIDRARRIAAQQGRDPNSWEGVKAVLPKMGKKTALSFKERARGRLAVHYVENICRHYDLLVWLTEKATDSRTYKNNAHEGA